MGALERVYKITDRPMTWTRAILAGFALWVFAIIVLGQIPSLIIYWFDAQVANVIDFSKKIPGIDSEVGLNTIQVRSIRDLVANAFQTGALIAMLAFAYFWQEKKRKRVGGKGLADPVKGYMPGK